MSGLDSLPAKLKGNGSLRRPQPDLRHQTLLNVENLPAIKHGVPNKIPIRDHDLPARIFLIIIHQSFHADWRINQ
jgi:hypothetical protein